MRERGHRLEGESREPRRVGQEAGDGFGDDAALLSLGPPLDQHLQVEPLGGQTLQGVLADGPEPALVHVMEETVFEVGVAQVAGVVVAQHPLDLRGGQYLTDDVEDGVVVQGVANLLELVEKALKDAALDGVSGHEVEDQAILGLTITVDAAHPLFEAVGVPGDVVVEQDVAALEVDALASRLGRDEDLDRPIAELLFGVQPGAGVVPRADPHAAVDTADAEAPLDQLGDEVVERVLELGEKEEPLVRVVEETLLPHHVLEARELRFHPACLDSLCLHGEFFEFGDLGPHVLGVPGERDRLQDVFQTFAFAFFHFFQLVRIGQVRRRGSGDLLGLLQAHVEPLRPVLQRAAHGAGARRQTALIQGHEEADGAGARVVAGGGRPAHCRFTNLVTLL